MERYTLLDWTSVGPNCFESGTPLTFDGTTVMIGGHPFLGFKTGGKIFVYTDPQCSRTMRLSVTLDPAVLIDATILSVENMHEGSCETRITTDKGLLQMWHERECCERVELLDVTGDPLGLIGGIIRVFEIRSGTLGNVRVPKTIRHKPTATERLALRTYTFYEIRTSRGDVTLRWGEPAHLDDNRYGQTITLRLIRR